MLQDDLRDSARPILNALERVGERLNALALLGVVREFYTKKQREELYIEYKRLRELANRRVNDLQGARPAADRAELERAYGKEKADEIYSAFLNQFTLSDGAQQALFDFESEHRALTDLIKMKGI